MSELLHIEELSVHFDTPSLPCTRAPILAAFDFELEDEFLLEQ